MIVKFDHSKKLSTRHPAGRRGPAAVLLLAVAMLGASCQTNAVPGELSAPPVIMGNDHLLGDPAAPVTVIEYASPACYWCRLFVAVDFQTVRSRYIDTGKVLWVFRHDLPINNADTLRAACAIECAADQNRFLDYWNLVYTHPTSDFSATGLGDLAASIGLDRTSFDACVAGGGKVARVQQDVDSGGALGVQMTPTFFVGTEKVAGYHTADELGAIIQAHLDQAAAQ
jgi:protein-disulfide isomerase